MNMNVARVMDSSIGVFICNAISLYNSAFKRAKPPIGRPYKKIILMKFWGMGSIVLASPAIRALRENFPQARITFLTLTGNQPILEALQLVDSVVQIDPHSIIRFIMHFPKVLYQLRKENFDLVVDFEFFTRISAITSFLICRRERIGFYERLALRGDLQTTRVTFDINQHVVDNFLNLARAVCTTSIKRELATLYTTPDADAFVELWLRQQRISREDTLIAINVNASDLSLQRRWPREHFAGMIHYLLGKRGVKIVLIGAPSERAYVEEVLASVAQRNLIVNAAGDLTIPQLLSLLKKSRLLITSDSGPLHFAVALNIPTVSFFGPETPRLYGPLGDQHVVFFKGLYCSPCLHALNAKKIDCSENKCMQAITVEEVIHALDTLLKDMKQ